MSSVPPAGPWPIEGVTATTWLVRFDEGGICTSPRTVAALLEALRESPETPVVVFSHGWNNDFADAVDLYARFLKQFEALPEPAPGPTPVFVGIIWPSIWLPAENGPVMATFDPAASDSPTVERILSGLRNRLPTSTDWSRLYALLDADALSPDGAREFAALVKPALLASGEGAGEAAATEGTILRTLAFVQREFDDRPTDIDELGTTAGPRAEPPAAAGLEFLDPRWALRLTTLYLMKDRAGMVGWNGVGPLLRAILGLGSAPVYAIGHSFGAKVVLSAVAAGGDLPRKLSGILLLQPAVSHLCFAENVPGRGGSGGYRSVLDRVDGLVLSTYSANDFPLHALYHRLLLRREDLGELTAASRDDPPSPYAALGGYGPRGAGETLVDPIPEPGRPLDVPEGTRLLGLCGSASHLIDGHGDVANARTAWALRQLMEPRRGT